MIFMNQVFIAASQLVILCCAIVIIRRIKNLTHRVARLENELIRFSIGPKNERIWL
mgnify:CR=1 FL=1